MIRFTTPSQEFVFHEDPRVNFNRIVVSYAQRGKIIVEKEKNDLIFTETKECDETVYVASFKMTQEETGKFTPDVPLVIQVRVLTEDGDSLASDKFEIPVDNVLKKEVLYED